MIKVSEDRFLALHHFGKRLFKVTVFLVVIAACSFPSVAADRAKREEPYVTSVFPIGVQKGKVAELEIRGTALGGTHDVLCDAHVFQARVQSVEDIELEPAWVPPDYRSEPRPARRGQRVRLSVEVKDDVPSGAHFFRLVTPQGISNRLMLLTGAESISTETSSDHQSPDHAQLLQTPAFVSGKISKNGEVDFYSFSALNGQELTFEVTPQPATMYEIFWSKPVLDAQVTLYEATGSWFSPSDVKTLAFNDEPVSAKISTTPRLRYRFSKSGRYLVSVGSFMGKGSIDFVYQLLIGQESSVPSTPDLSKALAVDTRFQAFVREIKPDRIEELWARTPQLPVSDKQSQAVLPAEFGKPSVISENSTAPKPSKRSVPEVIAEKSGAKGDPETAVEVPVPSIIEGVIHQPEEIDSFRFSVTAGQRLAFEIQTPDAAPPEFNPRLSVIDKDGKELFCNVYKRIGREFYLKDIEAKTLFTFAQAGEYTLQIRNIVPEKQRDTDDFRYRILLRDQVPHVGAVELHESRPLNAAGYWWKFGLVDRINLEVGRAKKFLVISYLEEEFPGSVVVKILDCPQGVEVLPGTELEATPLPPKDEGKREQFVPKTSIGMLTLVARADAQVTRTPQMIHVVFQPVLEGVLGRTLKVAEVPLMVIAVEKGDGNAEAPHVSSE